jgi:hypothetical protein
MDKNNGPNTKGDNKISRLRFLRLLGAGAIGYFAYRAGFINSLFGNANAAMGWEGIITPQRGAPAAGWLSSAVLAPAVGNLDEDGILMMAKPKPDGYSYRFDPSAFPSKDIRFDASDTGGLELKQEGAVTLMQS